MSNFTSTKLRRLKLDAKKNSRNLGIPLHEAQDALAYAEGFSSWALMMKNVAPAKSISSATTYRFVRSEIEMRAAMRNRPETFERTPGRNVRPNVDVPDIWQRFTSARHAIDFAIDYMSTLLKVPRFQVGVRSHAYWEMRLWLPYVFEPAAANTQVLANRHYKPVGMDVTKVVDYARFSSLHTKLNDEQIDLISHRPTGHGYLYGDSPWSSRKAAQAYLKRLHTLKAML